MTFIIHFKDGHRETYSNHYDENDEHERDVAWDDAYATFPKYCFSSSINLIISFNLYLGFISF